MKTLRFFQIIIGLLICISFFPLTYWLGYETRTKLLTEIYDNSTLIVIELLLIVSGVTTLINRKIFLGYVYIPISIIIVTFIVILFLISLNTGRPIIWEDNVVFKSNSKKDEIILQGYWFGITGDSPHGRIIITNERLNKLRKIEILNDSLFDKKLLFGWDFHFDSVPQKIIYKKDVYYLTYKKE